MNLDDDQQQIWRKRLVDLNVAVYAGIALSEADMDDIHFGWTNLVKSGTSFKSIQHMFPMLYGPDGPLPAVARDRTGRAGSTSESEPFCLDCAKAAFRAWRGWCSFGTTNWSQQRKEGLALPDLPRLQEGRCPQCGSTGSLGPEQIFYVNVHGPWNTGLPDYFVLKTADGADLQIVGFHRKWGRPYADTGVGRIRWPEMLRRIEEFYREQKREQEKAAFLKENFAGGGRGWDPSLGYSEDSPKSAPDDATITQQLEVLQARWGEIVGAELAAITRPLEFTGRKKRCLVVWADKSAKPPWGGWSSLSSHLPERRMFTAFRTAINKAIGPMEVDHVDFMTDGPDPQQT